MCSNGTVDYQGRQHDIDFLLSPYYGIASLTFADAQKTLALTYRRTLLYTERNRAKTTGLDAFAVRPANASTGDPPLPIPAQDINRLTVDCEGIVLNADGTYALFTICQYLQRSKRYLDFG